MAEPMTDEELADVQARLEAAVAVARTPWTDYLERRHNTGGQTFIAMTGEDPNDDYYKLYPMLMIKGQRVDDERLEALTEFLAHTPDDIARLLAEVRRLSS